MKSYIIFYGNEKLTIEAEMIRTTGSGATDFFVNDKLVASLPSYAVVIENGRLVKIEKTN